MYLPLLALLQTLRVPNNGTLVYNPAVPIVASKWQCIAMPASYSKAGIEEKCPNLLYDLNVCCAVWNDCIEQGKGERSCNRQYFDCNEIVLASASPKDFKECMSLPSEVEDHFNYISPRPSNLVLPSASLAMKDAAPINQIYQTCPKKLRTFAACFDNYQRKKILTGSSMGLARIDSVISSFELRVCLEMTLEKEDGVKCDKSVRLLLAYFDGTINHVNPVEQIQARSEWKCGSNRFDTYVTQVITGTGCFWLKEALNTCCKYQKKCIEEHHDKKMCDDEWTGCNEAVVTKTMNETDEAVNKCLPFIAWSDNYRLIEHAPVYESKAVASAEENGLIVVAMGGLFIVLMFLVFLVFVAKVRAIRKTKSQQYITGQRTNVAVDEESLNP